MTLYFFGKLSNGYSQYPFDFTSDVLDKLISNAKAPTQIITHRSNNLMYYSYIRKLEGNKYIGICCLWNDRYTEKISELFKLFENVFERFVEKGSVVFMTDKGNYDSSLTNFNTKTEDINDVFNHIKYKLDKLYSGARSLPPIEYSISKDSQQSYSIEDDISTIVKATYTYGYTYIYKDEDYDSVEMKRMSNVVAVVNAKNEQLIEQNNQLKKQIEEVNAKKKQYKYVAMLIVAIIACAIGIYYLNYNLSFTQTSLDNANNEISQKNIKINQKNDTIALLKSTISDKERKCERLEEERDRFEEQANRAFSIYPFIVSNLSISSDKVSFDYYANEEKEIEITLVATNTYHSEVISNSHKLTFNKGTGYKYLYFNRRLDNNDYYYVCILYDGRVIAGKRW
ncbi:MAG: hypothetical protein E7079_05220 [Bacteroidales bacterium]|nr:hypothetical protein [Bacteroidales bacterium]